MNESQPDWVMYLNCGPMKFTAMYKDEAAAYYQFCSRCLGRPITTRETEFARQQRALMESERAEYNARVQAEHDRRRMQVDEHQRELRYRAEVQRYTYEAWDRAIQSGRATPQRAAPAVSRAYVTSAMFPDGAVTEFRINSVPAPPRTEKRCEICDERTLDHVEIKMAGQALIGCRRCQTDIVRATAPRVIISPRLMYALIACIAVFFAGWWLLFA